MYATEHHVYWKTVGKLVLQTVYVICEASRTLSVLSICCCADISSDHFKTWKTWLCVVLFCLFVCFTPIGILFPVLGLSHGYLFHLHNVSSLSNSDRKKIDMTHTCCYLHVQPEVSIEVIFYKIFAV